MLFRIILILTILSCRITRAQGLINFQNFQFGVYIDKTNVRTQPDVTSSVLGQFNMGDMLTVIDTMEFVDDIINNRTGQWVPIEYKGQLGYVWKHTLSDATFRSHINSNQQFIVKISESTLHICVFEESLLVYTDTLDIPKRNTVLSTVFTSLGNTNLLNQKEVLVCANLEMYKTWTWDGTKVEEYNDRFIHPFLESFKNKAPKAFPKSIISGDHVNCRVNASSKSEIAFTLPLYALVDVLEDKIKLENLGGYDGWWSKIKYKNQIGYVWSNYLNTPQFTLNSDLSKHVNFVVSSKRVFAIVDGVPVDHVSFSRKPITNLHSAFESGNGGLKTLKHLIHVEYLGESCGEQSGKYVLGWDGHTFKYLFHSYTLGEADFFKEDQYFVPVQRLGKQNVIVHRKSGKPLESLKLEELKY